VLVESDLDEHQEIYNADWMLVTSAPLEIPDLPTAPKPVRSTPDVREWTDDFSNLFQVLKR